MQFGQTFGSVSVIVDDGVGVLVLDHVLLGSDLEDERFEAEWNAAVSWAATHGAVFADGDGDFPQLTSDAGTEFFYLAQFAG